MQTLTQCTLTTSVTRVPDCGAASELLRGCKSEIRERGTSWIDIEPPISSVVDEDKIPRGESDEYAEQQ